MIILGIDPGTATTGYGVIEKIGRKAKINLKYIACGTIKTEPKFSDSERLKKLYKELNLLIKKHKPEFVVVEKLFFFKNLKTAIPVAQARGVILLAIAKNRIPIFEFTPLQMKALITGYGRAEKKEIQKKIKTILRLKELPRPDDAADGLGLAICYARLAK